EDHQVLVTEGHFRGGQIEFPHAEEAVIIKSLDLLAVSEEALAPRLEGLGIMQAQDFNIAHQQPSALDRRQYLWKGRYVAAREDVFGNPGIGIAGAVGSSDRMQNDDAIIGDQPCAFAKEGVVESHPDMLEHANRHDSVESSTQIAVVFETERRAIGQSFLLRA